MKNVLLISNINKPLNKDLFSKDNYKISDLLTTPLKVFVDKGCRCFVGIDRYYASEIDSSDERIKYYHQKIYRNPFNIKEVIEGYKSVEKVVINNNIDLIYCTTPLGGMVGRLIGKKYNIKTIYEVHGFHFYKGAPLINWLLYYNIEKYLAKYTDLLIVTNKEDYDNANKMMNFKKVEFVHSIGIDFTYIDKVKVDRNQKRNEINIPEDSFLIISIGYINKNKNNKLVIDALSKINDKNIHYIVAGEGELKDELINYAEKRGIKENVHFLGFRTDVIELLKASDLYILSSFREGFSVSTAQACLSNIQVLSSNIRGPKDFVSDKCLFDVKNTDELVCKIKDCMKNTNIDIIEINKKNLEKYSISNVNSELSNVFEDYM